MLEGQGSEIFPKKRRNQFFGRGASSGERGENIAEIGGAVSFPLRHIAMGLHTRPVRLGFDPHYARDPLSLR